MEETVDIIFYVISYSIKKEIIEPMILDDILLEAIAIEYAEEYTKEGKEVFKVDRNVLYTEEGYIILLRKEDVDKWTEQHKMLYN